MDYHKLLQRHNQLLDDEALLLEQLREANGDQLQALERLLCRVAREGDAVFDAMLSILEHQHWEAGKNNQMGNPQ